MVSHLLKEGEAASYLTVSPLTLRNWRALGTGPAYVRVGRSVRYRSTDLEAWCATRTVAPSDEVPA